MKQTWIAVWMMVVVIVLANAADAQTATTQNNQSNKALLLQKHAELAGQLEKNQYRRPLFLESSETEDRVRGAVYAVLDSPFSTVSAVLKNPSRWCEILILHINTKYCHANTNASDSRLMVNIGKKTPQPLSDTFLLELSYQVIVADPSYLAVRLHAEKGPLSTSNYRMELQAVPLAQGKTFIYLNYSYEYGLAGRLAIQTYLATVGRGKVGFTKTPDSDSGYISGKRGTIERNTMRYYLAIEAYFSSLKQAPEQQLTNRLRYWFDATEEYSRQLHELDRYDYLEMKQAEYQRQQLSPAAAE